MREGLLHRYKVWAGVVAALSLTVSGAVSALEIRVNAGGTQFIDSLGRVWSADTGANTGKTLNRTVEIAATEDDELYRRQRWDSAEQPDLIYSFTVPNGDYSVSLHFAETTSTNFAVGQRVFNVYAEDQVGFSGLDIFAEAGGNTALVKTLPAVQVVDGQLNIRFEHVTRYPTVAGIEIRALTEVVDVAPPSVPTGLAGTPVGSTQVQLGWDDSTDDEGLVAGYRVFRNGVFVADTATTSYLDSGLTPSTSYGYSVAAFDNATPANVSAQSLPIEVVTGDEGGDDGGNPGGGIAIARINAGGGAYTDSNGNAWLADTGFNTGSTINRTVEIAGTSDDEIYRRQRWDAPEAPDLTYTLSVANGGYSVRLHFAETTSTNFAVGRRVFDVFAEDQIAIAALDIFAEAGGNAALIKTIPLVQVADGQLSIRLRQGVRYPTIAGIEVFSLSGGPVDNPPSVPQNLALVSATESQVALSWSPSTDAEGAVVGYRVYRNGSWLASTTEAAFVDATVSPEQSYAYTVSAIDDAAVTNESAQSAPLNVTTPAAPSAGVAIRVNAGGSTFTDSQGRVWAADSGFNTGRTSNVSVNILNTSDDTLYRRQRWDLPDAPALTYSFNVPNGSYRVNLLFAETWSGAFGTGLRVFDVFAENALVIDNLDIFAEAGGANLPLVRSVGPITVTDGQLNIGFGHVIDNPTLAGIEILSEGFSESSYDFSSADLSDWQIVNASGMSSSWQVTGGALVQRNEVGDKNSGTPFVQSYRLGTYAFLRPYASATDYRVAADVTPLRDDVSRDYFDGKDVGLMFRYIDDNNYYRISFSGQDSYARLEKRVNGTFSTLAVSARGYQEEQTFRVEVVVKGSVIQVFRDGEPLFGVHDTSLASGSVALYAQDRASFDNVTVAAVGSDPSLVIEKPQAYSVLTGNQVTASAVVINPPAGSTVRFSFFGSACGAVSQQPAGSGRFTANCGSFPSGEYDIAGQGLNAELRSAGNAVLTSDERLKIGLGGQSYVTLGDSITQGSFDLYSGDNISTDERILGIQGYQAPLADLLSTTTGDPTILFNNGFGGDRTTQYLTRIDSILARHPDTNRVLLMLGTNDACCSNPLTTSTYMSNMQTLVNKSVNAGKQVWVAKMPPTLPYAANTTVNGRKAAYNAALPGLSNANAGPDFWSFFYRDNGTPSDVNDDYEYSSLFLDTIHPNALGMRVMASLWHQVLTGSSEEPFYLRNLCNRLTNPTCSGAIRTSHKQTIVEPGYSQYSDVSYAVTSIPEVLRDGIWLTTANAEAGSTASSYIQFEVDRAVTVYVAYDAGASSRPNWLNSGYVNTGLTVASTDPASPLLRVYQRTFAAGTVTLGGNLAAGAAGADSNYVVIVTEN